MKIFIVLLLALLIIQVSSYITLSSKTCTRSCKNSKPGNVCVKQCGPPKITKCTWKKNVKVRVCKEMKVKRICQNRRRCYHNKKTKKWVCNNLVKCKAALIKKVRGIKRYYLAENRGKPKCKSLKKKKGVRCVTRVKFYRAKSAFFRRVCMPVNKCQVCVRAKCDTKAKKKKFDKMAKECNKLTPVKREGCLKKVQKKKRKCPHKKCKYACWKLRKAGSEPLSCRRCIKRKVKPYLRKYVAKKRAKCSKKNLKRRLKCLLKIAAKRRKRKLRTIRRRCWNKCKVAAHKSVRTKNRFYPNLNCDHQRIF